LNAICLRSKKLPWTDYKTGTTVALDWEGNFYAGTVPVSRFDEFIDLYRRHPESKAAGPDGMPAGEETNGVLGRLHLTGGAPCRIGKEVDRLDEDEEFTLDRPAAVEYTSRGTTLAWALKALEDEPASKIGPLVGVSERRFRDIRRGLVKKVQRRHASAIVRLAQDRTASGRQCQ
jgi:hypothetical protein